MECLQAFFIYSLKLRSRFYSTFMTDMSQFNETIDKNMPSLKNEAEEENDKAKISSSRDEIVQLMLRPQQIHQMKSDNQTKILLVQHKASIVAQLRNSN